MRNTCFTFALLATAGSIIAADPQKVTIPSGFDASEGGSDLAWPLVTPGALRFQQWFANSTFPLGLVTLRAISFRADGALGGAFEALNTGFLVRLSTTSNDSKSISALFRENLSDDITTVFNDSIVISTPNWKAPGPNDFEATIRFSTPFTFDTRTGRNLVLDIFNDGASILAKGPKSCLTSTPSGCNFDAQIYPDLETALARRIRTSAGRGSLDPELLADSVDSKAFIVQFELDVDTAAPLTAAIPPNSTRSLAVRRPSAAVK